MATDTALGLRRYILPEHPIDQVYDVCGVQMVRAEAVTELHASYGATIKWQVEEYAAALDSLRAENLRHYQETERLLAGRDSRIASLEREVERLTRLNDGNFELYRRTVGDVDSLRAALTAINSCIAYCDTMSHWYLIGRERTYPALKLVRAALDLTPKVPCHVHPLNESVHCLECTPGPRHYPPSPGAKV